MLSFIGELPALVKAGRLAPEAQAGRFVQGRAASV